MLRKLLWLCEMYEYNRIYEWKSDVFITNYEEHNSGETN